MRLWAFLSHLTFGRMCRFEISRNFWGGTQTIARSYGYSVNIIHACSCALYCCNTLQPLQNAKYGQSITKQNRDNLIINRKSNLLSKDYALNLR